MKFQLAAILTLLLSSCYKDDLAICRRENVEWQVQVSKLTVELHQQQMQVTKLTEELQQQEYALQMPDLIKGGVITITVFHGSDALQQCQTRVAQGLSQMPKGRQMPAWCRKLGKE